MHTPTQVTINLRAGSFLGVQNASADGLHRLPVFRLEAALHEIRASRDPIPRTYDGVEVDETQFLTAKKKNSKSCAPEDTKK